MRRGFAVALALAGASIVLLGVLAIFLGATYAPRVLSTLLVGSVVLAAGATALRQNPPAPTRPNAPPPPYVTPPLREPKEGEAPVIHVGLDYPGWNWTPDNPLGGSTRWSRYRNPASWDWEGHTRETLRFHLASVPSQREMTKAAKAGCAAARRALERRGGVKVHGEAKPAGSGLDLTLHVDLRSMQVDDANRAACLRAFADAFARALPDSGISAV